jgi:hypothetical protein
MSLDVLCLLLHQGKSRLGHGAKPHIVKINGSNMFNSKLNKVEMLYVS